MIKPCKICQTPIERGPAHFARRPKGPYCSDVCRKVGQSGAGNAAWNGGLVRITCERCGATADVKQSTAKRGTRFCSARCRDANMSENPLLPFAGTTKNCLICGKVLRVSKCRIRERNFCSRACADKGHSRQVSGQGNGRYVHGLGAERYPKEFRKITIEIRDRDGHQCRLCGRTEEEQGYALHVHHIDYDKTNNEPMNLLSVCQWCHGGMHGLPKRRLEWTERLLKLLSESPHPIVSTI